MKSYHGDHATGADVVHHRHAHHASHASHALKIRVFPPSQEDLVSQEVWAVVHHKATIVHPAGIAAVQVHVDVRAVGAALIGPTLEVLLLVESNLQGRRRRKKEKESVVCVHYLKKT